MNWMQKMQNKKETKETKSFFKGETNMQMQKHGETLENFI